MRASVLTTDYVPDTRGRKRPAVVFIVYMTEPAGRYTCPRCRGQFATVDEARAFAEDLMRLRKASAYRIDRCEIVERGVSKLRSEP